MKTSSETSRFLQLMLELDGDSHTQRREVTVAGIEALFDRVLNPPMLDVEFPDLADVDGAERELVQLVAEEANRVRQFIGSHPPPTDE